MLSSGDLLDELDRPRPAVDDPADSPAGLARRFELGTPALPTVHTALGGQEIVDEVGLPAILERNRALTSHLISSAEAAGFSLTLAAPEHRTFILMIRHEDPAAAVKHLAAHGIIVDYRPGHVRVSPHFYNTTEEIDRCIDTLAALRP